MRCVVASAFRFVLRCVSYCVLRFISYCVAYCVSFRIALRIALRIACFFLRFVFRSGQGVSLRCFVSSLCIAFRHSVLRRCVAMLSFVVVRFVVGLIYYPPVSIIRHPRKHYP